MDSLQSPPDYDFKTLEQRAQARWEQEKAFEVEISPGQPKYYCIPMMPYPSGALHMGHVRNYALSDVDARFQRLRGKAVLHAMSWDSFGLPAENAAIERGCSPLEWTELNIAEMRKPLKALGLSFDWRREFATHRPEYFQFEQRFFIDWFHRGWVYQKRSWTHWCPHDQTVLANEQITESGQCWRCGTAVIQKELHPWFIRLSDEAEALLEGLNHLPGWPDELKKIQVNWIGRSEVVQVKRPARHKGQAVEPLEVDLHHPELSADLSFWVISPQHPRVEAMVQASPELRIAREDLMSRPPLSHPGDFDKIYGFPLGLEVQHPLTEDWLPVWVSETVVAFEPGGNQVAAAYPNHQAAAKALAQKFGLQILAPAPETPWKELEAAFKKCGPYRRKILYRLKDWGVARQRYWGAPLPLLLDKEGRPRTEWPEQCPVTLPKLQGPLQLGKNPLEVDDHWRQVVREGQPYTRLPETFDTFFESSWYYLRYTTPPNASETLQTEALHYWLPIDHYIGGIEHATMHLLYIRFCHKLFKRMGWVTTDEPIRRMTCQGLVLGDAFYRQSGHQKIWVPPHTVENLVRSPEGKILYGLDAEERRIEYAGACKMSKSKKNGIEPQGLLEAHGADAVRLYMLFAAPPQALLHWQETGLLGATRFLKRIWNYGMQLKKASAGDHRWPHPDWQLAGPMRPVLEACLAKVHAGYGERFWVNVAIAALMSASNEWARCWREQNLTLEEAAHGYGALIQWLYPVAPHLTSEMWLQLFEGTLEKSRWPEPQDPRAHQRSTCLVVQVDGKKVATWPLEPESEAIETLEAQLLKVPAVQKRLQGRRVVQRHWVPHRAFNFVTQACSASNTGAPSCA